MRGRKFIFSLSAQNRDPPLSSCLACCRMEEEAAGCEAEGGREKERDSVSQ